MRSPSGLGRLPLTWVAEDCRSLHDHQRPTNADSCASQRSRGVACSKSKRDQPTVHATASWNDRRSCQPRRERALDASTASSWASWGWAPSTQVQAAPSPQIFAARSATAPTVLKLSLPGPKFHSPLALPATTLSESRMYPLRQSRTCCQGRTASGKRISVARPSAKDASRSGSSLFVLTSPPPITFPARAMAVGHPPKLDDHD